MNNKSTLGLFAALGGGLWFHISPSIALNAGIKLLLPIPTFSLGISPEVGLAFGL